MAEESAKAHPQHEDMVLPEPPPRRLVLDLPSWLPLERVPRPVMFGDRGEVALRGFDDPVRLFEVRWAQA